ncbi:MAG: AAA family ATPase, partial [Acidimicrobiia bacterium]
MKPERLEMAGFAPFRATTEVDFSGLELFALTGPTGAGKSSVIDAITFALYGVVARYDDKRSVEPVVSLGAAEARIRFDFTVGGRPYTAARVVRRNPRGGATTAEARLESDGEVIASGAAEVTRSVEALLGLNVTHFTRSVVLPQGDFASFLHDTPAGQQDLVKALLDLGVLERVRDLANERAKIAVALGDSARQQLESLDDASEEAEGAAALRLETLEGLIERVDGAEAAIATAEVAARERAAEVVRLRGLHELAAKVTIPAGVTMLADSLNEAQAAVEAASKQVSEADQARAAAAEQSEVIPTRDRLDTAADVAQRLEAAQTRHAAVDVDGLTRAVEEAAAAAEAAGQARDRARVHHEEARTRHAAHALAAGLDVG